MSSTVTLNDDTDARYESSCHGNKVVSGFHELWKQGLMCDTVLVVSGTKFPVHRAFLAGCSQYFFSMFTEGFQESAQNEITLKGVTSLGLKSVLEYAYTGKLVIRQDLLDDILEAAAHLQFTEVLSFCAKYLQEKLTVENCLHFLRIAELYVLQDCIQDCKKYLLKNFVPTTYNDEFPSISMELLCELLSDDDLQSDTELEVFNAALKWLHGKPDKEKHVKKILSLIRYGLMTAEEMENVYTNSLMVTEPCREIFQLALGYHMKLFMQPVLDDALAQMRASTDTLVIFGAGRTDNTLSDYVAIAKVEDHKLSKFKSYSILKEQRYFAGVVVTNNFLYIIGGQTSMAGDGSHATSSAFRYNPRDGKWLQVSSMTVPRTHFSLVTLHDSLVAVGGKNNKVALNSAERYSFQTNEWVNVPKLPNTLFSHAGCAHGENVYISGGCPGDDFTDQVHCLKPGKPAWQVCSPLNQSRGYHIMITHGNQILTCAGNTNAGNRADVHNTEIYDIETDQWTMLSPMPLGQSEAPAVLCNNSVYIIGGYSWDDRTFQNIIQQYDIDKDEWTVMDTKLPESMTGAVACCLKLPLTFLEDNLIE